MFDDYWNNFHIWKWTYWEWYMEITERKQITGSQKHLNDANHLSPKVPMKSTYMVHLLLLVGEVVGQMKVVSLIRCFLIQFSSLCMWNLWTNQIFLLRGGSMVNSFLLVEFVKCKAFTSFVQLNIDSKRDEWHILINEITFVHPTV